MQMTQTTRRLLLAGSGALALALAASPVSAQKKYDEGASDTEIKIGNTNPYSGNASAYGVIGKTIEAYFKMVNDQGGINGRKINFITYDDGYAPPKTVEMVRKLVEEDKVLFLFQTLGTPPNTAIHKYMNAKKVPQLFVATGASKWGDPKNFPWTMGWQPDYVTEAIIYAKHILANVKDPKIGVLMQNDDYGKDYFNGFKQGLGKDADKIVQLATYEVTDPTVDSQMIQLKNSGANVFFNITTPKFAAQAIKKAAEIGWKPAHYLNNVSASVGAVMKPAGFENGQGIITAAYIKDPTEPQWAKDPDMIAWNQFMDKYVPQGDKKTSFYAYGYAVTATLVEVLKKCGDNLTRENIMKQAASLKNLEVPLLLPGIKVNTGPNDFYPVQSVKLQRFKGETFELFGDVISGENQSN
jgi:branched-chain amino acid transport system substrate-binding protein